MNVNQMVATARNATSSIQLGIDVLFDMLQAALQEVSKLQREKAGLEAKLKELEAKKAEPEAAAAEGGAE